MRHAICPGFGDSGKVGRWWPGIERGGKLRRLGGERVAISGADAVWRTVVVTVGISAGTM